MKFRGSVTVFLSLIMGIIMSLIFMTVESARYSTEKMRIEMISRMGLESIFAEYNRELLKEYDLLFIDSSYGNSSSSLTETRDHLKEYIGYNVRPSKGIISPGSGEIYGLKLKGAEIANPAYATDNAGSVFKRQAIEAVKNRYGVGIAERALELKKEYEGSGIKKEDVEKRREKIREELKDADLGSKGNKLKKVFDKRRGNMANIVYGGFFSPKETELQLKGLASYRENKTGIGLVRPDYNPNDFLNERLFEQYLLWKCSDFTKDLGHSSCNYELEYIINGKNTDAANLRETVTKLFFIREAADTMAVFKDSGKQAQAKATALPIAAVVALLLHVDIEEALTNMILVSWGFAEAVVDVRVLLGGGRVALVKSEKDWNIKTVLGIPLFMTEKGKSSSVGMSYRDYLLLLLMTTGQKKKAMRAMDVIEMNMRTKAGNSHFRMDGCLEYLEADLKFRDRSGRKFEIRRDYSYMNVIE